jgi:hypothetical protein
MLAAGCGTSDDAASTSQDAIGGPGVVVLDSWFSDETFFPLDAGLTDSLVVYTRGRPLPPEIKPGALVVGRPGPPLQFSATTVLDPRYAKLVNAWRSDGVAFVSPEQGPIVLPIFYNDTGFARRIVRVEAPGPSVDPDLGDFYVIATQRLDVSEVLSDADADVTQDILPDATATDVGAVQAEDFSGASRPTRSPWSTSRAACSGATTG